MTVNLITPTCVHCRKGGVVEVDEMDAHRLQHDVGHIQDIMPNTPAPIREQIMTGTHPACWDAMMKDMDRWDGEGMAIANDDDA